MNSNSALNRPDNPDPALLERLRATTELLESMAADRALLEQMPIEDRERLHRAVAQVYNPDPVSRKRMRKAVERERNSEQNRVASSVLDETGIRTLRRKPVFTTPNVFAPEGFQTCDIETDEPGRQEAIEPQH